MVMPYQAIMKAVRGRAPIITAPEKSPIGDDQIQPSSLDLRLGGTAIKLNASVVPDKETFVSDIIERLKGYDFGLSPHKTNRLDKGATYLVPLIESCALPEDTYLEISPKSSAGRSDAFVRIICDRFPHFDVTPPGYHGPLFAVVTPMSFDVEIKEGLSLVQARIKRIGAPRVTQREIQSLHAEYGLLFGPDGKPLEQKDLHIRHDKLYYHLDLQAPIVGFAGRHTASKALDLTARETLDPMDFWEPLWRPKHKELILVPGVFYLLATKERVSIPQGYCAQMNSYDTASGEYRSHYAGFFDPGFGSKGGTVGVLEVRANAVNFALRDGHPICSMQFEKLDEDSEVLYEGSYTHAGPSLGKHFDSRLEAWTSAYWLRRISEMGR